MVAHLHPQIDPAHLPNATEENTRLTSPVDPGYNCIAWAANDPDRFWWPTPANNPFKYWPAGVPRQETRAAFIAAYATLGYQVTTSRSYHPDFDRIAIYEKEGVPTHAARQVSAAEWTSKLGPCVDIHHTSLEAVADGVYGQVAVIMERKRTR